MDENRLQLINAFKRFKNSKIWSIIVEELQKKKDEAQDRIETIGGDSEKIYTYRDLAILEKNAIIGLIEYPDEQIKSLGASIQNPNDLDNSLDDDCLDYDDEEEDDDA